MSTVLDRLEAAGYVLRVADSMERRRARIELQMDKIQPLVDQYAGYVVQMEKVNTGYTDEQLDLTADYLEKTNTLF